MTVESNLKKINNIDTIQADIQKGTVELSGDEIDLKKVEETVNELA